MNSERHPFHDPEDGPNPEVAELLEQLDAEAGRLGIALQETDFLKIGADRAMKLHGKVEIVLSALAVVAGFAVAYEASQSLFQSGPDSVNAMRLASRLGLTVVGGGGFALLFKGLSNLEVGFKRLHGYIRLKELRETNI